MKPRHLLVVLIFCLVLRGFSTALFTSSFDPYYSDVAAQVIMYFLLIILCIYNFKIDVKQIHNLFGALEFNKIFTGAALGFVVFLLTYGESAVFSLILSQFNPSLAYKLGNFHQREFSYHPFFSVHVFSFLLAGILLPAIAEEFFFRGLFFPSLTSKRTNFRGALVCSAIFTILHFNKIILINTFIFSFILCYLFIKQRSLYGCIAMHMSYNFLAFTSQYYFDFHRNRPLTQLSSISDWIPQLIMLVFSGVFLIICAYRYRVVDFLKSAPKTLE